jgi:hypothetical protein
MELAKYRVWQPRCQGAAPPARSIVPEGFVEIDKI